MTEWHDYFIATAAAAAILLGLVMLAGPFSVPKGDDNPISPPPHGTRPFFVSSFTGAPRVTLAVQSYSLYSYGLFLSLAMLFPARQLAGLALVPGLAIVLVSTLGIVECSLALRHHGRGVSANEFISQYLLPQGACALTALAGIGMLFDADLAPFGVAVGVAGLVSTAARNTLELFTRHPRQPTSKSTARAASKPKPPV